MTEALKFHHIGFAVRDLDATASLYENGGYRRSAVVFDPIQHVSVCWLTREGAPIIELLAAADEVSPVNSILDKVGVSPYHCCYVVDRLEDAVEALRKQKYTLVKRAAEAVAFNGSRGWCLCDRNIGLIELVEAPAEIVL